jgi:hypothetical protein
MASLALAAALSLGLHNRRRDAVLLRNLRSVYEMVQTLRTSDRQWVTTPYGEYDWVEPTIASGMKVTNFNCFSFCTYFPHPSSSAVNNFTP